MCARRRVRRDDQCRPSRSRSCARRSRAGANLAGVTETVPTYRSLMIHFDPRRTSTPALIEPFKAWTPPARRANGRAIGAFPSATIRLSLEEIDEVAAILGLPQEEIVALHSGALSGFICMALRRASPSLAACRRRWPFRAARRRAPQSRRDRCSSPAAKSLDRHVSMPTGWYQIGRTPARVFDWRREPMVLADIGDMIQFERIDAAAFARCGAHAQTTAGR